MHSPPTHTQHPTQQLPSCSAEGGRLVVNTVLSLVAFVVLFDGVLVVAEESISGAPTLSLLFACALAIICHLVAIAR